jgi:hypothetical protein
MCDVACCRKEWGWKRDNDNKRYKMKVPDHVYVFRDTHTCHTLIMGTGRQLPLFIREEGSWGKGGPGPIHTSSPVEDGTDSVPKRRLLILRHRGNTQKTIFHYNNTAKA